ncbi:hypothetical protein BBJ28_00016031, partial [Nothophytophthora sp. Chile5]
HTHTHNPIHPLHGNSTNHPNNMHCKADITFLLNPAIAQAKASFKSNWKSPELPRNSSLKVEAPPLSPTLSLFRSLSPVEASTSSLLYHRRLVAPYLSPFDKHHVRPRHFHDKNATRLPRLSFAALSITSSSSPSGSPASSSVDGDVTPPLSLSTPSSSSPAGRTRARKTQTPPCQVADCPNLAVSRGCCVRHGGGSKCLTPGCTKRAKLYQRCFQHGGFKTCTEPGCTKKAKRFGHCWSHGGGRICEVPECTKVSTQGGFCWAHGGGNRCQLDGCRRRSYLKYNYYCVRHANRQPPTAAEAEAESKSS